ncbi:DUF3164 family protein [Sinorhizobium meliloti]|uniref:DUF3164 family protein n=1 Tax=Rhizobium meliloti TaxID=382 RepID=UPI000FE11C28|nr:DUF3164 family protein [Sinorhizobium meliloti]MDX0563323.1 DUF3164 family protein [Sinorhizobium medicae]MDX0575850.1 DUF3164 family protein [Sinorhizobium medicae]MDX0779609.1 DUF3164 family protein [Sinorhizobium medicae]RVG94863.1 DUF3164 family protein [Sinorhizobium meliloti]RVH65490.1 DUF3164 family protein [Sinorhizobium meliloti]
MDVAIFEERPEEGITIMNGQKFMINAKGGLDPIGNVKEQYQLEDQTVRKCIAYAREASARLTRLKTNTFADLGALDALLAEKFEAKIGGKKGNRTYQSYDGLMKVTVQVSDQIVFGPELQVAKSLIDECLNEWSAGSRPEIQAIVTRAFNTDKEGQVNRSDVFMLLRLEIDDVRWNNAMEAIRSAIRVTGSKEYVRFYERASSNDDWQAITIDLAKA